MNREGGSATLITILLIPVVVIVLAMVADLGALRHAAARARIAADLAAVIAVNDQDDGALAADGRMRLARDAEQVAREFLRRNLAPLAGALADSPEGIAESAEIRTWAEGGSDSEDGVVYERPAVRIRADVPLRTGALATWLGPVVSIRARAVAVAR